MWEIHGEIAFAAEAAGATDVALCDAMDPTDQFQAKHHDRNSAVRYVQGDLHDSEGVQQLGSFDVVWCSGVIYHSPSPVLLLENLRRICGEQLMLGTRVIPEVPGVEQACIWYPGLTERTGRALADAQGGRGASMWGLSTPFDYTPMMAYRNYFWGITPSALRAMLNVAGFRVVEEHPAGPFHLDLIAEATGQSSIFPPADFARRRGRARRDSHT